MGKCIDSHATRDIITAEPGGIGLRTVGHGACLLLLAALAPACSKNSPDPPPPAPATPATFTVTPISTAQLRLNWSDVALESYYLIERSLDGVTYSQLTLVPPDILTYSDIGLLPSTPYFYRLTAVNRGGSSGSLTDFNFTMDLYWNGPTTGGPSVRAGHSAVYDSVAQRMIVFGGAGPGLQGDLWQLSLPDPLVTNPAWSPLTATGTPPSPRTGHTAVFDSVNNRMIVFGGQQAGSGAAAFLNDVWILDLSGSPAWAPATPSGLPPQIRRSHTAVYDSIRREMTVYGGTDNTGTPFTSFAVLSLPSNPAQFAWSSTFPPGFPIGRSLHAAIHDPLGPRMVIFAGLDNDANADGSTLNAETWTLSATGGYAWNLLTFANTPSLRQGHSAVYDSLNKRMIVFGGGNDSSNPLIPSDMWALNLGTLPNWLLMTPFGPPAPGGLFNHSAIYDSLYNRMVIFGGRTATTTYTDELWWILQ